MIKRLFKTVLYSGAIGLCVVLCRWIIELIFNGEPFEYGYLSDFMIGVSTYIILTLLIEINKIRKERKML